ncbi:MAG: 7-cyano-7-deazaguanine synthase [Planctomycetota bacterium]
MNIEKAVVLNSGGLNSAVASAIAQADYTLRFLHVRYGHRAEQREMELFEKQAVAFDVEDNLVVDMPHFAAIGGNARVSRKKQVEDALAIGEGTSNCYVPGLIGGLLCAAFTYASSIGAARIIIGVSENLGPPGPPTSSLYPDYAKEYLHLCRHLFGIAASKKPIKIDTPLMDLSRTEIIKLGNRLNTPFELTWSCISSGSAPCGGCVGCATRNRGFLDAAVPDPILIKTAAAR